ncbi:MAG: helix-turn-helix domain-containing protein [Egibacteraceae bacterium]
MKTSQNPVVFAVAVFNLRDARGWSQQDLANQLNTLAAERGVNILVSANTVSRWERGVIKRPQPLVRQLLAELFGVPAEALGVTRERVEPASSISEQGAPDDMLAPHLEPPALDRSLAAVDNEVHEERQRWCAVRRGLNQHRIDLSDVAAQLHRTALRVEGTALLSCSAWLPATPVELDGIRLQWLDAPDPPQVAGAEHQAKGVRPSAPDGRRYTRYSQAIRELDPPRLFENRVSYRLHDVSWNAAGGGTLTFGPTTYFEAVDVCEALAHELAAAHLHFTPTGTSVATPSWRQLPFRKLIGDPFDPSRRPLLPSINTLTIRKANSSSSFVLHSRDAGRVAVCGGMFHVMPAGVFQPSSMSHAACSYDFDLWRNMMREYSEEFLGNLEHDGNLGGLVDYEREEPFRSLNQARHEGRIRVFCLGVAVDPLTLWGEILTVAVIDADIFDHIFRDLVKINSEGTVVTAGRRAGAVPGIPFSDERVEQLLGSQPMAPAAAGCLALAWRHRSMLLND